MGFTVDFTVSEVVFCIGQRVREVGNPGHAPPAVAEWLQDRPARATDKEKLRSRDPSLCLLYLRCVPPPLGGFIGETSAWEDDKWKGGDLTRKAPAHALRWALTATMTEHFYACSDPDRPGPSGGVDRTREKREGERFRTKEGLSR